MWLYVDVFIIQNVAFNALAIYFALHLTGVKRVLWRIFIASLLGAIYALIVIITDFNIAKSIFSKIIAALLMLKVANPHKNLVHYLQSVIGFFIVTAFVSGLITFVSPKLISAFTLNDYFVVTNRSEWTLFFLLPFLFIIKWIYKNYITFKDWQNTTEIVVEAELNSQKISVTTVLDTGNNLTDLFTKVPVIVININILIEQGMTELFQVANKIANCENLSTQQKFIWQKYGKVIPFQTIGSEVSILPAIKPDSISYKLKNKYYQGTEAIIALASSNFFNKPDIQGLMHPVIYKSIIIESREG